MGEHMEEQMEEHMLLLGPGDGQGPSSSAASAPAAVHSVAAHSAAAALAALADQENPNLPHQDFAEKQSRYVSNHAFLNTKNPCITAWYMFLKYTQQPQRTG